MPIPADIFRIAALGALAHMPADHPATERLRRKLADAAEARYFATEAADRLPVTEDDRRAAREDNIFQQLHQSDKGIAERERGWDRGEG